MAITVSTTVVPVGASAQDEIVYLPDIDGVNAYQMLREILGWHDGDGGSPVVVASVMSAVTAVRYGKGPAAGITSAPAQRSLDGGASGVVRIGAAAAAAMRFFTSSVLKSA